MTEAVSREIRLKHRPVGLPSEHDFELVGVPIPTPGTGEVLVRNLYMSVDPYMRRPDQNRPHPGATAGLPRGSGDAGDDGVYRPA